MTICVCKYPLIVTDSRDGEDKVFVSLPLEILDGTEVPIPDIEVVEEKDFNDKMAKYMMVKWQSIVPKNTKRYNVNEHIVLAGCPEDQLSCDTKSIFAVYHPIDEWNAYHMIELKGKK